MSTHAIRGHEYDKDNEILKVEMRHPGTAGKYVIREYRNFPAEKYNQWRAADHEVCSYFFTFIDEHDDEYPVPDDNGGNE